MKNPLSGRALTVVLITLGLQALGCSRNEQVLRRPTTSEARFLLQQVLDKQEIEELLTRYMRLLETRDWVDYAQLFATDGELHFNEYHLVGSQVIRDTMLKIAPNDPKTPAPSAADLLTNVNITVNGETATGTSRWTGITLGADNRPAVSRAGRYEDTFVRENDRWRFQKRIVLIDVTPVVPSAPPASSSR